MEQHHSRADLNEKHILEQFKKNDETFRNTMERIFQKYSSLDDPGPDVCLKTMTFTSEKGSVPLNSATAEKELQKLRVRRKQQRSRNTTLDQVSGFDGHLAPLPAAQSVPAPVPSTQTGVPVSSDMQDISRWNCSCHQKIWMKTEMEALGLWPGSRLVRQPMNVVSLWRYPPQPELVETNTGLPSPKYFQLHPFFIWKPEHSIMQRLRNNYILPCLYSCPNPQVVSSGVGRPRVILGTSGQYYILSSRLCCKACKKYWFADKPQWLDMLPKRFCNVLPAFLTHKKAICKTVMDELRRSGKSPNDMANQLSEVLHLKYERAHLAYLLSMQNIRDAEAGLHMENSNCSLWCGSETSQLSLKSVSSSRSCLWGEPSQPEEEDRDLERTLNSHGSTLLDVYPSMLNQIGEAYRRQHVTEVASAVLHRYRRRRWQSSQAQHRNHGFSNSSKHALNRTRAHSLTAPKPPHDNITNHQKSKFKYQGSSPHKSNLDFSPLKSISNTSPVSTACFYSPRRDDVEKRTGVENGSRWTGQRSNSEFLNRPVRVLDLSTPPSSVSSSPRSPSPDLNQTYVVEPVPLPRSHGITASSVCGSTWSPLKMARMSSLASQGGGPVNSSPSSYRSGLRRDHVNSPAASPQRALTGHLSQLRSPLKAKIISLEHDRQTSLSYPKQALPVIHTSEVCRSPYKGQRYPSPHQQFPPHQENPIKKLKRQPSFSSRYSPSSSISQMPSRQIDAEFMSLYHHFICRSTNPTSSCHLCKRRSGVQSPAVFSTSVSALSLTPVRSRLKKRLREPEVVESLRFKRFRESCSPRRTTQFWPKQQQQGSRYVNTAMVEPNEDKYTWNRALLLQCPSPGFLRAIRQHRKSTSGSDGKGPGSRLDLQTQHYSPSWRDSLRCSGAGENFDISEAYAGTRSPMRTWDQSGVTVSPRLSRRRLLYGPLQ
ncbi:hypothetical protein PGIGA_G00096410 [Pangasianodon gigas]|uniref:Uncharacterized protein n=1 Tax=Pangasianodon gigas TaxID=30993 RepID=A0ACC5XDT0_PANGG|nr:hypothetical protein [Pangasianodon gigas]